MQQLTFNNTKVLYELIGTNYSKNSFNIYTDAKNDNELIKLNDKLFEKYHIPNRPFEINYFDDKEIAKDYFEHQSDPNLDEEVKDLIFKNFIATMKYNPKGLKGLCKHEDYNWNEIKSYD